MITKPLRRTAPRVRNGFEQKPGRLDFSIYNDPQKYGPDVHHDRGEILPITPERAKVVHETVGEVLQKQKTPTNEN